MDEFCGSTFWDWNTTWYTTNPDFTPCFEQTVLLWIPCSFLWISTLFEVYNYCTLQNAKPLKRSYYSDFKAVICFAVIALQITGDLYKYLHGNINSEEDFHQPAHLYSPIIKTLTLVLVLILQICHRMKGLRTSGFQFVFWFLLSVCEAISLRTSVHRENAHSVHFIVNVIYVPFVFVQFLFHCWADASPTLDTGRHALIEEESGDGIPCPELRASFLSKLLFFWVESFTWKGYKNPLKFDDLWELRDQDKSNHLVATFLKHSKSPDKNDIKAKKGMFGNVLIPIWKTFGGTYLVAVVIKQICDLMLFVSPQILSLLIHYVENYETEYAWRGYMYAGVMLAVSIIQNLMTNYYWYLVWVMGTNIRSTLNCAIYRKALRVSTAGRKESTTGEIVNLMSVDVDKIMMLSTWCDQMWGAPIQIGVALYFLYSQLGPAIFAGLGVLVILLPFNGLIMSKMESYQTAQMEKKDERVKTMNELLSGIKILKFYAWEPSFQEKVSNIRHGEVKLLKKRAYLNAAVEFCWNSCPLLISLASFATYVFMDKNNILNAEKAFVSLSLFNLLNVPTTLLPMMLANAVEAKVSLKRISDFFNSEESDEKAVEHKSSEEHPIVIRNGTFAWDEEKVTLKDININIKEGSLVAIVGVVGSGKSSLLSALLGDIKKTSGQVNVKGTLAYVSQQAWIQNATLQENILFGRPLEARRYDQVLDACALRPDLEILPAGDKTEIGEKGINLSGGQKQRIALARAAYNNANVYFLDDPLSAVDSHVGKHIFEKLLCSSGFLRNKTRVLVTHGVTYLPQMDQIIVLKDGEISECGTYRELLNNKGAFADFLIQYIGEAATEDELDGEESSIIRDLENVVGSSQIQQVCSRRRSSRPSESESLANEDKEGLLTKQRKDSEVFEETGKLIEEETTEVGSVKLSVYLLYFRAAGLKALFFIILCFVVYQGFAIGSNLWLSKWASDPAINGTQSIRKRNMYLGVYASLGISQCLVGLVSAVVLNISVLRASTHLHNTMLARIMKAPMYFFDTTPIGRIINRFSEDVQILDLNMPWYISEYIGAVFRVLATMVVISISTPIFLVVVLIVSILYMLLQRYYITSSRQLFRIESTIRSPIFSHFTETLNGTSTIRAYGAQERFIAENVTKVENQQKTHYPWICLERWLGIRLEALGSVVVFFAALFSVMERDTISSAMVGLSITYALQVTSYMNWLTVISSYLETDIVAVERISEYSQVVQEDDWVKPNKRPERSWPKNGKITFENYHTRYREGLDLVLKGVTCEIKPGEKIGIVGRTGAGKSSMTLALFRIIEPTSGSIMVDTENISNIGLHDLRSRLTIIPQDPVLFSGTLRFNLDPFSLYSDDEVWISLECAHLKDFVKGLPEGLDYVITEGGENLSVGQRQLVCLARAVLRKSSILILDEATAAVDLGTDDLIQETIRHKFHECTILTIAHRLNTIMDSTRIMVLDKGVIAEFDTPAALMENTSSIFFNMAKDSGIDKI